MIRTFAALAAASAVLMAAPSAFAQRSSLASSDWRQEDRSGRREKYASPQSMAFEVRFGPYYPEIDEEFGGDVGPYEDVFDNDPQFYFGVELDWLPLRIPWVGVIGPGLGWGYTRTTAPAMKEDTCSLNGDTCQPSGTDTGLTIMPMHLSAVLRADELMRRTGIPIVPYGKLGIGLATWSSSSDNGVSDNEKVLGRDTTWGIHMAVGGMFALNWLDERYSAALDESTGVNHVYLFGEWMNNQLDGLGSRPQMHVGTSTLIVGIAFDM
jgi:hypothetical protein